MKAMTRIRFTLAAVLVMAASSASAQTASHDKLLVVVNRAPATASIFKVDDAALTLLKNVPIGQGAREVFLSPDGRRAYVSNSDDNTITVIDLATFAVVATIADPDLMKPDGGAVSPDGQKLYVVGMNNASVVVISTTTHKVLSRIPVPFVAPRRVVFSPDGSKIYVGGLQPGVIGVIDPKTDKFRRAFPVGPAAYGGMAFTPDGKLLLAGAVQQDVMYCVDVATETVTRIQGVVFSPQRILVNPNGAIFVLGRMDGTVLILGDFFTPNPTNRHDKTKRVPVGALPWGMAVSDDGRFLYVPSTADNNITVIDTATAKVVKTIPVEKDPNGVAFRK